MRNKHITNKMELYQMIDKKQRHYERWLPVYRLLLFLKEVLTL